MLTRKHVTSQRNFYSLQTQFVVEIVVGFLESSSPPNSLTLTQTIYTVFGTSPSLQVTGLESASQ